MKTTCRFARRAALVLLDAFSLPVPHRIARWLPWFMRASPREYEAIERIKDRLR